MSPTSFDGTIPWKTWVGFGHVRISEPIPTDQEIRYFGHLSQSHSPVAMAGVGLGIQPYQNHTLWGKEDFCALDGQKQHVSTKMT